MEDIIRYVYNTNEIHIVCTTTYATRIRKTVLTSSFCKFRAANITGNIMNILLNGRAPVLATAAVLLPVLIMFISLLFLLVLEIVCTCIQLIYALGLLVPSRCPIGAFSAPDINVLLTPWRIILLNNKSIHASESLSLVSD
jgi:hypothetical protein